MLSSTVIVVYVASLMLPCRCCLQKEYEATDGQCCPMCHEGTVVRRDCTLDAGTRCVQCGDGTYMNQPNGLRKCFLCTNCNQGLFEQRKCTASSDTLSAISPSTLLLRHFNIHIDTDCITATEFLELLHCFSFTQHVNFPTHNRGHILDLVCSSGLTTQYITSPASATLTTIPTAKDKRTVSFSPVSLSCHQPHHSPLPP
ncbi:hypothetical protein D5F01_LYC08120 [Larimichthys crocea]|uniref:TNFR-Cys domain-containing protein n=1 Tax=Larimichthys crocea TaxID=215358 RepID=A0A6G0INW4_LARCR|nr:hypothetical protein D5F01_LYC08120 [Larimichthys crocea]